MNNIRIISLLSITLLVMPIFGMQPMEIDTPEPHGTKRKHDEVSTIYQPSNLTALAARSFVNIYVDGFTHSSPANREIRCKQFWTDIEDTPIEIQELIIHSLNHVWKPVSINNAIASKKFKIFVLLLKTTKKEELQNIVISFFASEKAKTAFSKTMLLFPCEIISYNAFNDTEKKNIISKLDLNSSLNLGVCLLEQKDYHLKKFLNLGLNVRYYSLNPSNTLLSYAIRIFDLKKIDLLLQYRTPIPMFSATNNVFSLIYKHKRQSFDHDDIIRMVNTIAAAMNKKIIPQTLISSFIIANPDESDIQLNDCVNLTYTTKDTITRTPFYLSPHAADELLGKAIIPRSQEPVANT